MAGRQPKARCAKIPRPPKRKTNNSGPAATAASATNHSAGPPVPHERSQAKTPKTHMRNELQWTSRPSGALSNMVPRTRQDPSRSIFLVWTTHQRASTEELGSTRYSSRAPEGNGTAWGGTSEKLTAEIFPMVVHFA